MSDEWGFSDEFYSLSAEQYAQLYWNIRSLDLPKPSIIYTTFIHPEGKENE